MMDDLGMVSGPLKRVKAGQTSRRSKLSKVGDLQAKRGPALGTGTRLALAGKGNPDKKRYRYLSIFTS